MTTGKNMQASQANDNERLWTVAQTAEYLNVSVSWVYRATERSELPHLKLGGLIRFVPRDIRAHAEALAATASGAATVVRLNAHRRQGGR